MFTSGGRGGDENLTVTHAGRSTISWCIAAEGLDYANPNQTPPRHSEGGLWGSAASDGRSTLHHVLYAHNRLRNPRTTGGDDVPPVLTLYNNVVYNWSENATHTAKIEHYLNNTDPRAVDPVAGASVGFIAATATRAAPAHAGEWRVVIRR